MSLFSKKNDDDVILDIENSDNSFGKNLDSNKLKPDSLTVEEVLDFGKKNVTKTDSGKALEMLRQRMMNACEETFAKEQEEPKSEQIVTEETIEIPKAEEKKPEKKSLLDKCMPYILDENGVDTSVNKEPLYKLQSVAEILRADSAKALERLSEKYDMSFETLGVKPTTKASEETKEEKKEPIKPKSEASQVKNIQSNVPIVISDIDNEIIKEQVPTNKDISSTATITFTPVDTGNASGVHLSVSSKTMPIDLTGEISGIPDKAFQRKEEEVHLEKNEFEDFIPEKEINTEKDILKAIRTFSLKKRNAFLITVFSFVSTFVLAIFKIPIIEEALFSNPMGAMIVCLVISAIVFLLNIGMFKELPGIFTGKSSADSAAILASLAVIAYSVFALMNEMIFIDILLILSIVLSFRALGTFYKFSYLLASLKQLHGSGDKFAVKLINEPAITFAMVKNSIEGDSLLAVAQKTDKLSDFVKYTSFGKFLGGKLPVLIFLSLVVSLVLGISCALYFNGLVYGLYVFAAVQCFAALPIIFLIDNLPLYAASKKLARKNAMIAGKTAAEYIEMSNVTVLSSGDIFPKGSVTLHQMKVLSENNLEDTILRAASLTETLNSPLAPIFKQIAGTANIEVLPDSDTVKYEERMGISGWVNDRLMFIGNRTLMEAHGIKVPPVEVDRKILRGGFFPVYVASGDKAYALLIIQYNPDSEVVKELRKLTGLGVTLLIDSCDPNLTEEMICDYLGLYEDSVKVMTAAGCHMYRSTVLPAKKVSAPAMYKGSAIAMAYILNCAARIKRSNVLLTVLYVISLALGVAIFAYASLSGSGSIMSDTAILIYTLISTVVSYLGYRATKP